MKGPLAFFIIFNIVLSGLSQNPKITDDQKKSYSNFKKIYKNYQKNQINQELDKKDPSKFKMGDMVCLDVEKGFSLWKSKTKLMVKIEYWNEDRTKAKVKIIKGDGYFNNEYIYEGKYIWINIYGWYKCN